VKGKLGLMLLSRPMQEAKKMSLRQVFFFPFQANQSPMRRWFNAEVTSACLTWSKFPSSMAVSKGTMEGSLEPICIFAQFEPRAADILCGPA
jgi:hypothetical protein